MVALMASEFPQRLAARVKAELQASGRTQAELAAALGVNQTMISRRFTGRYSFPLRDLPLLAEFFDTTVESLLAESVPQDAA